MFVLEALSCWRTCCSAGVTVQIDIFRFASASSIMTAETISAHLFLSTSTVRYRNNSLIGFGGRSCQLQSVLKYTHTCRRKKQHNLNEYVKQNILALCILVKFSSEIATYVFKYTLKDTQLRSIVFYGLKMCLFHIGGS